MYFIFIQKKQSADKEQAPGAFDPHIFSSRIGTAFEELKSFEPTTPKPSPLPILNAKYCKGCIQDKIKCTREEPVCWACSRRTGTDCQYPPLGENFERSPSTPVSSRGSFSKKDFSSSEGSEKVSHSSVKICITLLTCFGQAGGFDKNMMDIDGDDSFTPRRARKRRGYESGEESDQSSEDSNGPKKPKSSKKTKVSGATKLILKTNRSANTKRKKVVKRSSSTSDLSLVPDSEEDPLSDDKEENGGKVNRPL
jgi:hypothetical protein